MKDQAESKLHKGTGENDGADKREAWHPRAQRRTRPERSAACLHHAPVKNRTTLQSIADASREMEWQIAEGLYCLASPALAQLPVRRWNGTGRSSPP